MIGKPSITKKKVTGEPVSYAIAAGPFMEVLTSLFPSGMPILRPILRKKLCFPTAVTAARMNGS